MLFCSSIRNFLASTLDCIVVQMRKTNGEMGSSKLQNEEKKIPVDPVNVAITVYKSEQS